MYPVTAEFKEKILLPRRQVFGKVQIDYTDPFIDQSISMSANENANISYPAQTADSVQTGTNKIASLDGSWMLDGTYRLAPTTQDSLVQMGWWGSQLAGVNGAFTVPYPALTVNFIARPITKLKVVGDPARGEYPVDFTIQLLDVNSTVLYTETVIDNNAITWTKTLDSAVTSVTAMVLTITKWSHAGRQSKIIEFYTLIQEVYEGKDIITLNYLEEMGAESNSLPIGSVSSNQITLKLSNLSRKFDAGNTQSPLYGLLKNNRRIKAWMGIERSDLTKEFVPLGTFWSQDWDAPEDGVYAQTTGLDRLSLLTNLYNSGILTNITLYDLSVDVLTDAGLTQNEFWVDPDLQNTVIPYIDIINISHKEVLRMIAEASLGNVFCDRYGVIKVQGSKEQASTYTVSENENANISYPNQVVDKIEAPDANWTTLDGSWVLGEGVLPPTIEGAQMGWYGSQLSDALGNFTAPYPTLTIEFLSKAIESIKVVGDSIKGEYPVDFTVRVYDILDTLLATHSIVGNTNIAYEVEIPENPTNASKVTLEITKWSHPNRQAKIIEFIDTLYFLTINPSDYFRKNNPAKYSEVANYVEVSAQPFDINGNKLEISKVIVSDGDSITDNGLLKYSLPVNDLIQTTERATEIANAILASFKDPKRNLELEWRGQPALLLRDQVYIADTRETNKYKIVRQELTYDGSLRAKLTGRRA